MRNLGTASEAARRVLDEQLQEVSADLARRQERLQQVEQALAALDQTEVETTWVISALTHFDTVWDTMTLENRGRLVRAVVERVDVDEPSGVITTVLADPEAHV